MTTKERPILFRAPMVRAILESRKTQTRRILKFPTGIDPLQNWRLIECSHSPENENDFTAGFSDGRGNIICVKNPYGKPPDPCWRTPGDRLWVRETWQRNSGTDGGIIYRADYDRASGVYKTDVATGNWAVAVSGWRPSIFMPRWASRITLEITGVRVERLQEISEASARAEGIDHEAADKVLQMAEAMNQQEPRPYAAAFETLWQSIHGFDSWDANPWVWVVEFKRVEVQS